jgi:CubicO group peptidase (beta-lactamase class C family)
MYFNSTSKVISGPDYMDGRTGTQLYVSRYGEQVLDIAVGSRGEDNAMTISSSMAWLCCSKPVLLIPLMRALAEAGADESAPVARFIPEFGSGGKDEVTIAHLLTHTVPYESLGMRWTDEGRHDDGEGPVFAAPWSVALKAICAMPVRSAPGASVTYTAVTNWHVLAEILQRLTGRPYEDSVVEVVFDPLGMDDTRAYLTEESAGTVEWAPLRTIGKDGSQEVYGLDQSPWSLSKWPGLTCRGPAREMARVMECIAGWRHPQSVDPQWRAKLLTPVRLDLCDPVFEGSEVQWSLGLCTDPMSYGLPLSKRVAGYTGVRSSFVVADLETGVTVAFISSLMPQVPRDWARKRRIIRAVYNDLGMLQGGSR